MKKIILTFIEELTILMLYPFMIFRQFKTINKIYNSFPFFLKRKFQQKFSLWNISESFFWNIKLLNNKLIILKIESSKDWFNVLAYYNFAPEICHIEHIIVKHLNSKSEYFDIGANNGHRSFRILTEKFKVHLIDANPVLCKNLNSIMEVNQFQNYKIKNIGISDQQSNMKFYVHKRSSMSSFLPPKEKKNDFIKTIDVQCTTLDNYFLDNSVSNNFHFIKIDVEGLERKVIQGAQNIIKNFNSIFLIEITNENDKIHILELFSKENYKAYGLNWGISGILDEINFDNKNINQYSDFLFIKNEENNNSLISSLLKL